GRRLVGRHLIDTKGVFTGKQQPGAGLLPCALGEHLAAQEMRVLKTEANQTSGIQGVAAFLQVLQDGHTGAAAQPGDCLAQAVRGRTLAPWANRPAHRLPRVSRRQTYMPLATMTKQPTYVQVSGSSCQNSQPSTPAHSRPE